MKKILFLAIAIIFQLNYVDAKQKVRKHKQSVTNVIQNKNDNESFIEAKQAVLIDCDSGEILFEKNSNDICAPSSMTKLMTLYLLFSAIKEGRIKMEDELPVSENAQHKEGSRSFYKAGTSAKVEDLIRSIVVHSGNDSCTIVAEALSGDDSIFAEEMNQKALEFGLKNSHFTNPAGLPDNNHYSTVHDLAVIAQRIIKDFPEYYHYFSEKVFEVNGISQQNRNTLLGNSMGVDGLKTGHTNAGGYGLVASTSMDGKRLIVVVNGCKSSRARAKSSNQLLAFGFKSFVRLKTIIAGTPIFNLKVWLGTAQEVGVCLHENLSISIPRKYQNSVKIEAKVVEPIEAPVSIGTKIGTLTYRYDNFKSKEYDLFACANVAKANIFERGKVAIKYLLFGNSSESNETTRDIDVKK